MNREARSRRPKAPATRASVPLAVHAQKRGEVRRGLHEIRGQGRPYQGTHAQALLVEQVRRERRLPDGFDGVNLKDLPERQQQRQTDADDLSAWGTGRGSPAQSAHVRKASATLCACAG